MSTNPGQNPNPTDPYSSGYGGYGGYTPPSQQPYNPDDPYGDQASGQQSSTYQDAGYGQQQQQQYNTYQPPLSAARRGRTYESTADSSSMKMAPNMAALLSYALWWVGGLFFFVAERKNRFVRFSAAQSFLLFGAVSLVYILLRVLTIIPLIGFLLSPILSCLSFVVLVPAALLWIFLMVQAYRGVKVKIPVVGDYAEGLVERFTRRKRTA
jgi:uncharacterized membrane protein